MTQPLTTNEVIRRFKQVHKDTYNYSKVNYINSYTKVGIICPIHGEFLQLSHSHLSGNGCPLCMPKKIGDLFRQSKEKFIEKSKKKFKDQFDYSQVIYKNCDTKILLKCNKHNIYFKTTPFIHLKGEGSCPKCRYEKTAKKQKLTKKEFIEKAQKIHGKKYNYEKVKYINNHTKVCIICPIHGEFWQTANSHMAGQNCPICSRLNGTKALMNDLNYFITKAKQIHGNKYDYSKSVYIKASKKIKIICPIHGEFWQIADAHLTGKGCRLCVHQISKGEQEIVDWLISLGIKIKTNNRTIIKPYEIDIYLPAYKIGIEYNGIYWHCEKQGKDQFYHKNKTQLAIEKGIRLLQFWDNEWRDKQEIVKSIILNTLNKTPIKLYARKLLLKSVISPDARKFCDQNHIHGFRGGSFYLGLYQTNELQALMITNKNGEMVRFVTKINTVVIGGFSRLLKHSPITYSFVDARLFTGKSYTNQGFDCIKWTKPNYFYTQNYSLLESRQKYQKHKLPNKLSNYDPNKTEVENMFQNGWDRLWDCGHFLMKKASEN